MRDLTKLSRRDFLVAGITASGGFLLGVASRSTFAVDGVEATGMTSEGERQIGFFITINPDNTIVLGNNQPEIGQGILTTLPMLIAEELEVDFSSVSVVQMPLGLVRSADGMAWKYGGQGVGGSTGLTSNWQFMREVGARARLMLQQAAASLWNMDVNECKAESGYIRSAAGDRAISYGELAPWAAKLMVPKEAPALKKISTFKIAGKFQRTVDCLDIVTGRTKYGMDTRVAGMKVAVIARCPYHDGEVISFDASEALQVPGVIKVLQIDGPKAGEPYLILASGIAVVANDTWSALEGKRALKINWSKGPYADESTASFDAQCEELLSGTGQVVRNDGDIDQAMASANKVIEAGYQIPFVSHAPMEPQNCFAEVSVKGSDASCRVIVPTQMPAGVSRSVAAATGIDRMKIEVEMTRVGGGFGRRLTTDYAAEAAMISQRTNLPIKLIWSREDDIKHDFYRPSGHHHMKVGVDDNGMPLAWTQRLASASKYYRSPNMPDHQLWEAELYIDDFPANMIDHFRLEYFHVTSGLPRGSWRAPAHTANAFVIQSFIDEIAHQTGQDPLQLRLDMLGEGREIPYSNHGADSFNPGRLSRVLKFVADKIDYARKRGNGTGVGLAAHFTFGGYCAHAIEVNVDNSGQLQIERIVAAMDCGYAVNPNAVEAQMQGATVDGLSTALNLEITVKDSQIVQSNFHDYPLLRLAAVPEKLECHILNWDEEPRGVGEIALPTVAPALTNAIFAATGKRIRRLPIKDQLRA